MTLPISDESETIYRNRARVLFDEEESVPENERRRTRVSARFDRSSYEPETYHHWKPVISPMARTPMATSGFKGNTTSLAEHVARDIEAMKKHDRISVTRSRYTVEELSRMTRHGSYELQNVYKRGHNWVIEAVCRGGHCAGTKGTFGPYHWMSDERMACPLCKRRQQVDELNETVNREHGVYRFIGFTRVGTLGRTRVIGMCTGPRCGGKCRYFSFAAWQTGDEGRMGCVKCSAPERGARARETVLSEGIGTPLLDAAEMVMRANDQDRGAS